MNGLIRWIQNKQSVTTFEKRAEHQWIFSDPLLFESFEILKSYLSDSPIANEYFNKTLFLKVDGSFACAIDSGNKFVLIYPELIRVLKSKDRIRGIAILAHELGHLVLKHQSSNISNIQSQIEADLFANELGLGKYLLEFLKERSMGQQIQLRIQALEKVIRTEN
jgi:Zn-dependent protease with chaperone function